MKTFKSSILFGLRYSGKKPGESFFATHFTVIKYLPSLKSMSFTPVGWAKDPELKYSVSFSLPTFLQG